MTKLAKAIRLFLSSGWPGLRPYVLKYLRFRRETKKYQTFVASKRIDEIQRADLVRRAVRLSEQPLISIILPVFNVEKRWLESCINSVLKQTYPNWELCIADDCSTAQWIRPTLERFASGDSRIKIVFRKKNGHISAASNSALELAAGEFCVLLDHDDELAEDALFWVANEINEHPEVQMIYSDEDLIDKNGHRTMPKFKPDFSRDLLYSLNMVTHLSAYRTEMLRRIDGFRVGLEGSQDYDLALRFIEQIDETQIRHIPRILYHWRAIPGSVALSGDEKPYAHERAREAIREHFARTGVKAEVEATHFNLHRVRYVLPEKLPKVSLILAGKPNEPKHVVEERWRNQTDYGNLETIFAELTGNAAQALNAACEAANGDVICFLDAGLVPRSTDWLNDLAGFAIQPKIGSVTAKISNLDFIVGGGLVLGGGRISNIAHENYHEQESGSFGRNVMTGNFSAVSASCMAVRRELFLGVGGFDAVNLPFSLFDADLCLRLGKKGLRSVFNPFAVLTLPADRPLAIRTAPTDDEKRYFSEKWKDEIANDPFSNPNYLNDDGRFILDA